MRKGTNITPWVLQILIAALFLFAGVPKLMSQKMVVDQFRQFGFPEHFYLFTGILEVLGALGVLIPATVRYGAMTLMVVMVGATATLVHAGQFKMALMPLVTLILLGVIVWLRRPRPAAE